MEVETVSQQHINNSLITSAHATNVNVVNSSKQAAIKLENNSLDNGCNGATTNIISSNNTKILTTKKISDTSRSNSPASSSSENDKEIQQHTEQIVEHLENRKNQQQLLSTSLTCDIGVDSANLSTGDVNNSKSNGSLSGASTNSTTTGANNHAGYASLNNSMNGATTQQLKKRISSSRTPTRKAKRIKFYRNGDRFYPGITIPVSNERYRSFESLFEDLTRLLEENVKIPGAVRTIYSMDGKKISTLEELEDGLSYVCSCNNENFKKIEYNTTSQPLANITLSNRPSNRLTKLNNRPSSPLKNGNASNGANGLTGVNGSPLSMRVNARDSVVRPRIVTLIRNGTKPRKIMRLLLNKRNSPSFDHVMTAITQVVKLDTGCVRKVFTVKGNPVLSLVDFFGNDDIFFAYGTERVNNAEDFKLEIEEHKALQAIRKNLRTPGGTCPGPKPKMPVKSKKCYDMHAPIEVGDQLQNNSGIDPNDLPQIIRDRYALGEIIGDGNFAVVLKIKERQTGQTFALKIIDKSKCKGKEHYIDAEVRVMKKLEHPNIISLIMDIDHMDNMLLVLEYVSGGDLFDAITRVTRFSEDQSRVMIRRLALAMAYLHSMGIVHRDIKPENLLVELDGKGNVIDLKLADFGLACEVTEPLFAVCGTPTYVAPEILMETGYGLKIDVWAAGIILYILLCGFPPFVSPDNQQEPLFDAIISGVYDFPEPYWSDIGDGVRDLIANMLQSDPEVRFTSEDILDHYWTCNEYNDDEQQQIENAENYVSSS